jgi:hypothetical protein
MLPPHFSGLIWNWRFPIGIAKKKVKFNRQTENRMSTPSVKFGTRRIKQFDFVGIFG